MEETAVEDFQDYQPRASDSPAFVLPNSPDGPSRSNDPDLQDDGASISGSAHHSSDPDEAVFDMPSHRSSPRTSHGSSDDLSVLESSFAPHKQTPSAFIPLKTRSPFRNPSSVRAMQTDITPPRTSSPPSQRRHRLHTPSRQCTPRSARSHNSAMGTPSKMSTVKKMKKEYPLVLLHVTLLPLPLQYSPELLEAVLPPAIQANWKLLQEKATPTVQERGVLIPHPREDYDLLEERLLESLELKQPRILKCGHFHLSPEESADMEDAHSDAEDSDPEDADLCEDCGRRIRDGKFGDAGTGAKRWDIKIFAANGLMRAGAWGAAWREMERVDVEILPWMEESMKRELELRREEDESERRKLEQHAQDRDEGVGSLDDERLREIYGQSAQDYVDGLVDDEPAHLSPPRTPEQSETSPVETRPRTRWQGDEVPLWDLLWNYIRLTARDRKNLTIVLLGAMVLFLSVGLRSSAAPASSIQMADTGVAGSVVQVSESGVEDQSTALASVTSAVPSAESAVPVPETEEAKQPAPWIEAAETLVQEIMED